MVFKLVESRRTAGADLPEPTWSRWLPSGAKFENGVLLEREEVAAA